MSSRFKSERGTESPMDFQFTSRASSNIKPVWAQSADDPFTSKKRAHDDLNPPTAAFPGTANTPTFGANHNVPFIFQSPVPSTPHSYPWAPPPHFSPEKAFPQAPDIKDVDMTEVSPEKTEDKEAEGGRAISTGGMTRTLKARHKARSQGRLFRNRSREGEGAESDTDGEDDFPPLTQNTSNHYTLNLPSPPVPQSDLPYVLLGYLQFFFNLSLILVFLYLVLQFILTVQRDVEQRISEYSMDIVQETAMCSSQFRNNLCSSNPIPAMMHQCASWETCMNRDPTIVGRAKVGAELIAEVVNGFVEPISWKTLAFTLTSLSFLTVFINSLLSLYRSRLHAVAQTPPIHPQPPFAIPPATPYAPHTYNGFLSPAPMANWGRPWSGPEDENLQTPSRTRRRRLEGGIAAKVK